MHEDFDGVVQVEFVDAVGWEGVGVDVAGGVEGFGGLPGWFVAVRDGPAAAVVTVSARVTGSRAELDAFAVDDGFVMAGAEQDQIGEIGPATPLPCEQMMGVEFAAPGAGRVAASFAVDRAEQVT